MTRPPLWRSGSTVVRGEEFDQGMLHELDNLACEARQLRPFSVQVQVPVNATAAAPGAGQNARGAAATESKQQQAAAGSGAAAAGEELRTVSLTMTNDDWRVFAEKPLSAIPSLASTLVETAPAGGGGGAPLPEEKKDASGKNPNLLCFDISGHPACKGYIGESMLERMNNDEVRAVFFPLLFFFTDCFYFRSV